MTVKELRNILKDYLEDTLVIIENKDWGFDNIELLEAMEVKPAEEIDSYEYTYADLFDSKENTETAVVILGHKII